MPHEGLTIELKYREHFDSEPYIIRKEFTPKAIDAAEKNFMYILAEETKYMWHKLSKEVFPNV